MSDPDKAGLEAVADAIAGLTFDEARELGYFLLNMIQPESERGFEQDKALSWAELLVDWANGYLEENASE